MLPIANRNNYLSRALADMFGDDLPDTGRFDERSTAPAVNVKEEKNNFLIELAAPGLNKKDFSIDVNNNVLTISHNKKEEDTKEEENYVRREFYYSTFRRSFTLPESVMSDKIEATHKDGILEIKIPKKEEAKEKGPKKIDIK